MRSGNDGFPHSSEPFEIKHWWDSAVVHEGSFSAYAFFLLSSSRDPLAEYLRESGGELTALAGSRCLLLSVDQDDIRRIGTEPKLQSGESQRNKDEKTNIAYFKELMKDTVAEGYSARMREYFKIPSADLPGWIFFQGIFSLEHVFLSLAGLTKGEMAPRIERVFSALGRAGSANESILKEFDALREEPVFQKEGTPRISPVRNIAGKTFQIAIELWIKSLLSKSSSP
ncbi:MAG: hypothetical protein JW929_06495 [Anaerolineales bacterium]|nr:hypothetical protein [Anaerolineales bacterium]